MKTNLNLLALLTALAGQGAQVDQDPGTGGRERLDIINAASRHRISCPRVRAFVHMGRKPFVGGFDLSMFLTGDVELTMLSG